MLFQNNFEIANPLGSAKKKHKIIGVYLTLSNIYFYNRSTIAHMQLVLLRKESYSKTFGI